MRVDTEGAGEGPRHVALQLDEQGIEELLDHLARPEGAATSPVRDKPPSSQWAAVPDTIETPASEVFEDLTIEEPIEIEIVEEEELEAPGAPPIPPQAPEPTRAPPRPAGEEVGVRLGGATRKAPAIGGRAESPPLGIDFGTTYSKVALYENGNVFLLEDEESDSSYRAAVPSMVAFLPGGSCVVGEESKRQLAVNPGRVVSSVKRVMGLRYSHPLANGLLGSLACHSKAGPDDAILFEAEGTVSTVPEVCARILEHLRDMSARWTGSPVKKVALTVPVDFDVRARRELLLACKMAGLEVLAMVAEPVAAVMGCGQRSQESGLMAVYDFGGGTFDASIVEVGGETFKVRGAAGDRWLGGDDFDELLAHFVADSFQEMTGVALRNRAEEWQRLLYECEDAKRRLSSLSNVDVIMPNAAVTSEGPTTLFVPVSRTLFEEIVEDTVSSSLEICRQALEKAGIGPSQVSRLYVTGGTSRVPIVRRAAQRYFGKPATSGIFPEHAVVLGAALRAAVLGGLDVPEDIIERLSSHGRRRRTIGIALAGGKTEHVISGVDTPPVTAHRIYSTSRDNQTVLRLELVHGTSELTEENGRIGGFVVEGLPPRPAGAITLDVYFEMSSTGTLFVTAQERETGARAQGSFPLPVE